MFHIAFLLLDTNRYYSPVLQFFPLLPSTMKKVFSSERPFLCGVDFDPYHEPLLGNKVCHSVTALWSSFLAAFSSCLASFFCCPIVGLPHPPPLPVSLSQPFVLVDLSSTGEKVLRVSPDMPEGEPFQSDMPESILEHLEKVIGKALRQDLAGVDASAVSMPVVCVHYVGRSALSQRSSPTARGKQT